MQWVQYIMKQSKESDKIKTVDAYGAQPVIEFNDEISAMVNGMCSSKFYRGEDIDDQVTAVCAKMLGSASAKKEVLSKFLGKESTLGFLVQKK